MEEPKHSHRLRLLLLGAGIPTIVSVIALVLIWRALPDLPNPVAIHWGRNGAPDGFGSAVTYLVMVGLVGWLLPLIMAAPWKGAPYGATSKFMVMSAVWLSIFISFIAVGSVLLQRGLGAAQDAPGIGFLILWAVPVATVGALAPYFLLPEAPVASSGTPVEPLPLLDGQTAAWTSIAKMSRWFVGSLTLVIVVMAVGALFAAPRYLLGTAALLTLLLLGLSVFKVSVGQQGLLVRGYLGFPKVRAPLDQIAQVDLVQVAPLQDWGGWGLRFRPGGHGIITRAGSAIQVVLKEGKVVVVTADDSAVGAATLAALVDRIPAEN